MKISLFISLAWFCVSGACFSTAALIQDVHISTDDATRVTLYPESPCHITVVLDLSQKDVNFITFQVHTYHQNYVELSTQSHFPPSYTRNGTNMGITVGVVANTEIVLYLRNLKNESVSALVMVTSYSINAPVPGGCNEEFMFEQDPTLEAGVDSDVVDYFQYQYARVNGSKQAPCEGLSYPDLTYTSYILFFPNSEETYFDALKEFFEVQDITQNVQLVASQRGHLKPLTSISSMSASSYLVSLVVNKKDSWRAAYVPVAMFKEYEYGGLELAMVSCFLVIGVFMCLFGHVFFLIDFFFCGFLTFTWISILVISAAGQDHLTAMGTVGVSCVCGLLFGVLYGALWYKCDCPVFATFLKGLLFGLVLVLIVLVTPLYNLSVLRQNYLYWIIMGSVPVIVSVILLYFTKRLSMLSSAVVGSTCIILPISYYVGSSLHITVLNALRRAHYFNYNHVTLVFSFQSREIILTCVWAALGLTGYITQALLTKNKPDFERPPNARWPLRLLRHREQQMTRREPGGQGSTAPLLRGEEGRHYYGT